MKTLLEASLAGDDDTSGQRVSDERSICEHGRAMKYGGRTPARNAFA